jgi:hypothetical protein
VISPQVPASAISLTGSAQQGMSTLVNVLAVNSMVNVLTNLTINIGNGTYNTQQLNLNGLSSLKSLHP